MDAIARNPFTLSSFINAPLKAGLKEDNTSSYSSLGVQPQTAELNKPLINREFSQIISTSRMFGGGLFLNSNPKVTSYTLYRDCLPKIFDTLSSNKPIKCLDLGSGIGLGALSLLAIFKEVQLKKPDLAISILGADINDWAVNKAQQGEYDASSLKSNWRPILRDLPELHSHLKIDNPLLETLNKQREALMEIVFKIIRTKDLDLNIFELNKSLIKKEEEPIFKKVNPSADQITDFSKDLVQCFGIFPNINLQNTQTLLKIIAKKLISGGILFSDLPLLNHFQNCNLENVFNSGLGIKKISVDGVDYQVLEKIPKS